jgi:DNA polymerase-1
MIMDADAAQLEWRVAAQLSQDPIMIQEIIDGVDCHLMNALKFFGDSRFRQDAKIFSFRMIYGGTSYAFFMDRKMPDFPKRKWDKIVEEFYGKYSRLKEWQDENLATVCKQGYLQTFTGRRYIFERNLQRDGSYQYERPPVCNYPVQGTATGDIIPMVMVQIYRKIKSGNLPDVKIINQVHDSIVLDLPKKDVDTVAAICYHSFRNIPQSVKTYWGYNWTVPMEGDLKIGENWSEMKKYQSPSLLAL